MGNITFTCKLPNEFWEEMDVEIDEDSITVTTHYGKMQLGHADFYALKDAIDKYNQCASLMNEVDNVNVAV